LAAAGFLAGAALFAVPLPAVVLADVVVVFLAAVLMLVLGFLVTLELAGTLFLAAVV
jgi:hypothetical protein